MTILTIPNPLFDKLGKEESDALLQVFEKQEENLENHILTRAEDKFEKRLVEEISGLEYRLTKKMDSHFKWIIMMWATTIIAMFGLIKF